jgi:MraZ protein
VDAIIGTYECKVDAKGRLLLPAPLKKQLAASLQNGFVLKRSVFSHVCISKLDLMMQNQ